MEGVMEMQSSAEKVIPRDRPAPDPSRAALVKRLQGEILEAKKHWKKDFDKMRRNMKFANGVQWPNQREDDPRYVANIVQRILKTTVASGYAKNPTVVATPRRKLNFKVWDGKPETAMRAQQTLAQAEPLIAAGQRLPAEIAQLVAGAVEMLRDVQEGTERIQMIQRIGDTLVMLINYYMEEGGPGFKLQMKQMVRRARTTGVGYVKLAFQREMQLSARQNSEIADLAERLAAIGRLKADIADGEIDPMDGAGEELKQAIAAIQSEPEAMIREGILFNFPLSTRIIPSITTEKLMGWVGAEWIAEEIMLTPDRVKEVYGVDLSNNFTAYRPTIGAPQSSADRKTSDHAKGLACVWVMYDKRTGLEYVIAEGYPDFLKEPGSPDIFIEQFFPYFAVTFNDMECEGVLFPNSDVELLRHGQMEYNRMKEGLRQHRIANRPLYLAPNGAFEDEEEKSLTSYAAHDVIKINAIDKGQKASDILMPVQKIGVDPNLYETGTTFEDMQRVSGNQEAVIGGTSNATATADNIAEGARQGGLGLDVDDLDDMLTALMRAAGQLALAELDAKTVIEICGPGAVWPQLSRSEIAKELNLAIKAGSSGRPNQAREAANFERLAPTLLQIPGVSPRWLAERAIRIVDDNISLDDAIAEGLPAILMQNRMAQVSTGDPATDPSEQGEEGGDKNRAEEPGGTSQAGFPAGPVGGASE
jgi:hypothetical protein